MFPLEIRLFGKFNLLRNERQLECFASAKARELFCYLLLHRDQPHSREILASLLWSGCTTAQSKKYFRQTLWQLQLTLHKYSVSRRNHMLQIDGAYVSLDPEADFRLDVAVLETAFNSVRGIAAARLHRQQARMLESAVALYTGHLLEGWLQDWCIYQRERLQSMYLAIMEKLMTYCELRGRYEAGVAYGERILAHDRGREQTYLKMMRLHYEAGDRAGALRQFQRCVTALQEELNVEPSKETCSLYEQIRTDELKLESWGLEHSEIDPQRGPVASLTGRLCKLRSILLKLNKRVKDDLKEIDHALSVGLDGPRQAKRYSHNPH